MCERESRRVEFRMIQSLNDEYEMHKWYIYLSNLDAFGFRPDFYRIQLSNCWIVSKT